MEDINNTISIITSFYDKVNTLFENSEIIEIITTKDYSILIYNILLPKSHHNKIGFLLPISMSIDVKEVAHQCKQKFSKFYIIDVFQNLNINECLTPNEFFDFLFDISPYDRNINYQDEDFGKLKSLFVSRKLTVHNQIDSFNCNRSIESIQEWGKNRKVTKHPILILGERGFGKTWFVKRYCLKQLEEHKRNKWINPIPIYINLRLLSSRIPGKSSLFEILLFHIKNLYKIKVFGEYFFWEALIRNGNIILILDGFDEMSQEVDENIYLKQIWDLSSVYEKTNNIVLTSRTSFFYSTNQINKYFSIDTTQTEDGYIPDYLNRIVHSFNIFKLNSFSATEIKTLHSKYLSIDKLGKGIRIINKLKRNKRVGNIEYEILELSKNPAFYDYLINYFERFSEDNLLKTFEDCLIDSVISFNIDSQRAIDVLVQRKAGELEPKDFKLEEKNIILENLAWYVFETEKYKFNFKEIAEYKPELFEDYEILINDIKTQTVLTLDKGENFAFLSQGVLAYYIASSLITSFKKDNLSNIAYFGKKSFSDNKLGERIAAFLKVLLKKNESLKIKFSKSIQENLKCDALFLINVPYLIENLNYIDIHIDNIENRIQKINIKKEYSLKGNINFRLITPNVLKIKPFYVCETEVTNNQYLKFLNDKSFEKNDKYAIYSGKYWHPKVIDNRKNSDNNPFSFVINDYHYFNLSSKEYSRNFAREPVVYISWFAAAAFCNWLSLINNVSYNDLFYQYIFTTYKGKQKLAAIRKNCLGNGYRLPFEDEWNYLATEGKDIRYPWEILFKNGRHTKESREYKNKLLQPKYELMPVKMDNPNTFNVYGIVGNVREWVDERKVDYIFPIGFKDHMNEYIRKGQVCRVRSIIKGSTWRKGIEGFNLDGEDRVYPENTNLDVGFRIAKNMNNKEYLNTIKSIIK